MSRAIVAFTSASRARTSHRQLVRGAPARRAVRHVRLVVDRSAHTGGTGNPARRGGDRGGGEGAAHRRDARLGRLGRPRRLDSGARLAPRWVLTAEHRSFDNAGPDDWVMLSGAFLAARAHRPNEGPRRDPHWMLFGVSALSAPGPRAGGPTASTRRRAGRCGMGAWLDRAELTHDSDRRTNDKLRAAN